MIVVVKLLPGTELFVVVPGGESVEMLLNSESRAFEDTTALKVLAAW